MPSSESESAEFSSMSEDDATVDILTSEEEYEDELASEASYSNTTSKQKQLKPQRSNTRKRVVSSDHVSFCVDVANVSSHQTLNWTS